MIYVGFAVGLMTFSYQVSYSSKRKRFTRQSVDPVNVRRKHPIWQSSFSFLLNLISNNPISLMTCENQSFSCCHRQQGHTFTAINQWTAFEIHPDVYATKNYVLEVILFHPQLSLYMQIRIHLNFKFDPYY